MVGSKFGILSDILKEPLLVNTPVGDSVVEKRVYRNCPIMLPNRVPHVQLVKLDMVDFDVIFGMDRLHVCFAYIYCMTRVVKFNFPNEPVLEWEGEILFLEVVSFLV